MNRSFLRLYNNELHHLRHTAAEFAREYPKIAGRLSMETEARDACADPFVERLLEGVAYLTARVQLKLEAEFPQFTESILETVFPQYLSPTPAMAVVAFEPDPDDAGTPEGFLVPRGSSLRGASSEGETQCEFRTAHPVQMWPLRIAEARYYTRDLAQLELPPEARGKAALRIRLETNGGVKLKMLELDALPIYVRGLDEIPVSIFEQLMARRVAVVLQTAHADGHLCRVLPAANLRRLGLSEEEALLPYAPRGFEGHRLLHEYFALPQRFQFFELSGLRSFLRECDCTRMELIIVFQEPAMTLENRVDAANFQLFCTPVINLFPRRLDPISLLDRFSEFHVVADRTRPADYEIYQVTEVIGYGATQEEEQTFQPFYLARDQDLGSQAYYSVHRLPRTLSVRERRQGALSSYLGSEVYLSLVDGQAAPFRTELQQLGLKALCTNRHLPIQLATGAGATDFTLDLYAPVRSIRCLQGPTIPVPARAEGELAWRVLSHLSLNYLSLVEEGSGGGAAALQDLLKLYSEPHDARLRKQIEGVRSVASRKIVRRVETPGPLTFARGLEINLELDENAFEGTGIFLLGSVLERFFARHVSLNSFTETVVRSTKRGEIMRWPARPGSRQIL